MLAQVNLLGRLGKDPEMSYGKSGTAYTHFTVATSSGFGEQQKTSWWNCTAFGKTAEYVNNLTKGTLLHASGDIAENDYEDKQGNARKSVQVTVRSVTTIKKATGGAAVAEEDASDWVN